MLVHPRAGLFLGGQKVAFWVRGGVAFHNLWQKVEEDVPSLGDWTVETSVSGTALSAEGVLVVHLGSFMAATLTPSFYYPVGGKMTVKVNGRESSDEASMQTLAIMAGVAASF
jgi:hypothetical protein